jgi:hypothetical protein
MPLGQDDNHTEIPPTLVMGQFASKNGGVLNCTGWVLACQVLHLGETDKQYNGVARTLARGQNQSKGLIPTLTLVHYLATWAIPNQMVSALSQPRREANLLLSLATLTFRGAKEM